MVWCLRIQGQAFRWPFQLQLDQILVECPNFCLAFPDPGTSSWIRIINKTCSSNWLFNWCSPNDTRACSPLALPFVGPRCVFGLREFPSCILAISPLKSTGASSPVTPDHHSLFYICNRSSGSIAGRLGLDTG